MRTAVLDHGYLELVESWGSDESIIAAARMSTAKGFLGWGEWHCLHCKSHDEDLKAGDNCQECGSLSVEWRQGDEKLLAYLWNNKHATPFEMAGMVIEVQAPIMVFREWHRHRTQSFNEMSGRYVPLPDLNYVPSVERLLMASRSNKQAGVVAGAEELDEAGARRFREDLRRMYKQQEALYQVSLQCGVPKELARVHLPVGRYSRMRASANLRNWLAFLTLRMDEKAQWEIRQFANEVGALIAERFPRTWALFSNGR